MSLVTKHLGSRCSRCTLLNPPPFRIHKELWTYTLRQLAVSEDKDRLALYKKLIHILKCASRGLGVEAEDNGKVAVTDDCEDYLVKRLVNILC